MEQSVHGFSVPFEFPVVFTRNAFAPENRLFVDTLRRKEPARRHRALIVVDSHVATAHPGLANEIDAYFDAFPDALSRDGEPLVVRRPGVPTTQVVGR